jgi:Domain of unknown function (DUF4386)
MNQRRTAKITGILFITATTATVLSQILISPLLLSEDMIFSISNSSMQFQLGMLFELINAFASAGIAISLFSILRKMNEILSVGYLGLRLIEGTLGIVAVIYYAALLNLANLKSISNDIPSTEIQSFIDLLLGAHDFSFLLVLIAFNIGAFFLYYLLYWSKLVPRGIAIWGIIGALLLAVANFIQFFDIETNIILVSLLSVPIAINEMALAIWLILKGFNIRKIA